MARELRDSTVGLMVAQAGTLLVLLHFALFYCFVLRARFELGRWPELYHPDPKDLGFIVHHVLVWLSICALPFAPFVAGVGSFAARELGVGTRPRQLSAVGFFMLFGAAICVLLADPGGFGMWFAD